MPQNKEGTMDDEIKLEVALMRQDIGNIKDNLHEIKLAVIGDGNGRKGIVRNLDEIKAAIAFNAPKTMEARVCELENFAAIQKALFARIVVPVIVTETVVIIGFIAGLLTNRIAVFQP